jgi:hypothetical protein
MSHPHQQIFCLEVKKRFAYELGPTPFYKARVLDVGSLDVNGSNRFLFVDCAYTGIDVVEGPNVDHVVPVHEWLFRAYSYHTIICTETLEHDMHWEKSLPAMVGMLKPKGLLVITCATTNRSVHGTKNKAPESSGTSQLDSEWVNYYRNLTEDDFRSVVDFDAEFSEYEFKIDRDGKDLYFWGLKR